MKIKITSIDGARKILLNENKTFTNFISILDPGVRPFSDTNTKNIKVRTYHFYDLENIIHKGHPTKENVEQILLDHATLNSNSDVLIHCTAGISRSTAVAVSLLVQSGISPFHAMQHVSEIRSVAHPNSLIIRWADELLNQKGELIRTIADYKRSKSHLII